jgi:uncharacterized protein YndB with AHSA1/START domain/DNA-binding transcriptional ArsR family regulator
LVTDDMDPVFKALADASRRRLLDALNAQPGQTLGALTEGLDMTRQAVSQHLAVLQAANLVTTLRRGREKLHYLNPVPIHAVQARWIAKFERPRLDALAELKDRLEGADMDKPQYVYVTYILTTPEKVWAALTDAELSRRYWGRSNVSDWKVGSTWSHALPGEAPAIVGEVLESDPPNRLVTSWWRPQEADNPAKRSRVSYEIAEANGKVRLTISHWDLDEESLRDISRGWPAVLSNLKTFLETGATLPDPFGAMPCAHPEPV